MKKLHLILLSLLTVSLITYCPASSSGNPPPVDNTMRPPVDNMMPPPVDNMMPPPVDNTMPPPTDITTAKTIHAHVRDDVSNNAEVVDLTDSITVTDPTYSILEGNTANIFSINSSTGVITIADASKVTYDNAPGANNNNVHLLKVRARDGTDITKATEAPLRIVVRDFNEAFITTWTTTEANETITIPTTGSGYDFTVNWGDDSTDTTHMGNAPVTEHEYATAKTYTIRITRDFPRIFFQSASAADKMKIQTIEQWGSTAWSSMQGAFLEAGNLTVPAVDAPNLAGVTSMASMFNRAGAFNQDINHWDTSNIQNMNAMFSRATAFNQDISGWDTSMVTNMSSMFRNAQAFNQSIGTWNTEKVTNMSNMFRDATAFNQPIGTWNTAKVDDMSNMFNGATAFNQPIGTWNTGMVTDMSFMFNGATAFDQNIGTTDDDRWNTAKVTTMNGMFQSATAFNQPIGTWNTAKVDDMNGMFFRAGAFNQPIGTWNTGMVTNMASMFFDATVFNQPIGAWNTAKVTNMRLMFRSAHAFNQDIGTDGNSWNTAMVENMNGMFNDARAFNQDISNWDVSEVIDCSHFSELSRLADSSPPLPNFTACAP